MRLLAPVLISAIAAAPALAQDDHDSIAQANNPLATMKALNFQNYYIGDLTDTDDTGNSLYLRYAQPVSLGASTWLVRATLPANTLMGLSPDLSGKLRR